MSVVSCQFLLAAGFITPGFFVAGLLAASIPIVIHILNRRRFKTIDWAAMEFLLRALRRNRRRLRFEHWLLLAIRCCVLLLLGLALARPMGCSGSTLASLAARRAGLHVIVIDNSYSMAYEADRPNAKTNFDQAKILAKGIIDRLSAGGEAVAIITAARPAASVMPTAVYDLQAAKDAVDRIQQSYGGTDLIGAMDRARQLAQTESRQPTKTLHIITDGTRSAWEPANASALANSGRELASSYHILHYNVGQEKAWNQAIIDLHSDSHLVRTSFATSFLADARSFGQGSDPVLQWRLDDQAPPGSSTTPVHLTSERSDKEQSLTQIKTGGLHVISASLATVDRLKEDDIRRRVIDVAAELKVLIVEGERGAGVMSGSGAYLQLALAPPPDPNPLNPSSQAGSYVAPELISDLEVGNKVLADYRAVIFCNVGAIQPLLADQLTKYVEQGGTLMLFMGEGVAGENYNATLLPKKLLPGPLTKRLSVTGDQKPFLFDFKPNGNLHPFLKVFSKLPRPGLETAQVFTYWQVEIPPNSQVERVLNYLPVAGATTQPDRAADPAITVHDLGAGRVVFVSTTANGDWSTLTAKQAYLPLMHELLAGSVNSGDAWMNLSAGDSLQVPGSIHMNSAPVLRDPQQTEITLEQTATPNGAAAYRSRPLAKPGLYSLQTGSRNIPIAVNVPSDEADVRPVDSAGIHKAMGDIDIDFIGDQLPPIVATNTESGTDFGWSLMTIVLVLAAMECLLAMRFGHYRRAATV